MTFSVCFITDPTDSTIQVLGILDISRIPYSIFTCKAQLFLILSFIPKNNINVQRESIVIKSSDL
jgi:hypothetical protein